LLTRIEAYALPSDQPNLRYVAEYACSDRKLPGRSRTPSCWALYDYRGRSLLEKDETAVVGCVIAQNKDGGGVRMSTEQ
jgi:hypothetical protein